MLTPLPLLIIGAGPFGLALAAYAKRMRLPYVLLGKPMDFWKEHMPANMFLRSACDWHFDPFEEHTILRYLQTQQLTPAEVEPLTLKFYLGYAEWFQRQYEIVAQPAWVEQLTQTEDGFEVTLAGGEKLAAKKVVLALGFRYFKNIPEALAAMIPPDKCAHTCDCVEFSALRDKRVLIIGGRQSAFEWAALLREQGAREVHMAYRHATPAFATSDWSWETPLLAEMVVHPNWFRALPEAEKVQLQQRLWSEGRLKLEPWLAARIQREGIVLHPHAQITACREVGANALEVRINDRAEVIDYVIFATGYKMNVANIPFLAKGNVLARLETKNGFPVLDEQFQSNVRGLYFTSMCATQDFGPFFAFTAAVRASALILGAALREA